MHVVVKLRPLIYVPLFRSRSCLIDIGDIGDSGDIGVLEVYYHHAQVLP